MDDDTLLDRAHARMQADEEDIHARMRYFDRLSEAELFLLLEEKAGADAVRPRILTVEGADFALAFDREERLADFAGEAPYAAVSGRALAGMLAAEGLGLGLNLDVAPSSLLLEPAAMDWLAQTLANAPVEGRALPCELAPPEGVAQDLIEALGGKLALAGGLAEFAWLVHARYDQSEAAPLLAVVGALPRARDALVQIVNEALMFAGVEGQHLDVAFFEDDAPICARLERVGLGFDLRDRQASSRPGAFPGMDPGRPPRLK